MRLIDVDDITEHEIISYLGIDYADCLPDVEDLLNDQPVIDASPTIRCYNDNQNYHEVDEFRCSRCGLHLEDWSRHIYDEDLEDEFIVEYAFKYCPECGAKVGGR